MTQDQEFLEIELRGLEVELDIKRKAHIFLVRDINRLEIQHRHIELLIEEVKRCSS